MRRTVVVRLSSKGQIIIPASLRRRLGLTKGQPLEVRPGKGREIVFVPVEKQPREVDVMLRQARTWFAKTGNDPLAELERRRRKEREIERKKHERWSS